MEVMSFQMPSCSRKWQVSLKPEELRSKYLCILCRYGRRAQRHRTTQDKHNSWNGKRSLRMEPTFQHFDVRVAPGTEEADPCCWSHTILALACSSLSKLTQVTFACYHFTGLHTEHMLNKYISTSEEKCWDLGRGHRHCFEFPPASPFCG